MASLDTATLKRLLLGADLLGEVALQANLRDQVALGLEPVHVLLLAGEDGLEQQTAAVVALGDADIVDEVVAEVEVPG